jgi:hypothetical protein
MLASAIGVIFQAALVILTAATFTSGKNFLFCTIAGLLFTVSFALAVWHGKFWNGSKSPRSAFEWLLVFALSLAITSIFILIDVLVIHPGLSLLLTLGAMSVTFIALPSAVRAWMIVFLSERKHIGKSDG